MIFVECVVRFVRGGSVNRIDLSVFERNRPRTENSKRGSKVLRCAVYRQLVWGQVLGVMQGGGWGFGGVGGGFIWPWLVEELSGN